MRTATALGLFVLLAAACGDDTAQQRSPRVEAFVQENSKISAGSIVFLGASTIERWTLAASFPALSARCVNRGLGGETIAQLSQRAVESVPDAPAAIILHAGAYDLFALRASGGAVAEALVETTGALRLAFPAARLIVLAPLPGRSADDAVLQEWRHCVAALRAALTPLNCRFVLPGDMLDASSRLRAELSDDGQHPNSAGYAALTGSLGRLP